jgi:hypothetical protein
VPRQRKEESPERRARLNAMSNYPFQDNFGSVDTALCPADDQYMHPILRMASPARRRLAQHVFDEMCIGRSKMRIVDVPEALKVCCLFQFSNALTTVTSICL